LVVGCPAILIGLLVLKNRLQHEAGSGDGQPAPGEDEENGDEENGDRELNSSQQDATEREATKPAEFTMNHGDVRTAGSFPMIVRLGWILRGCLKSLRCDIRM